MDSALTPARISIAGEPLGPVSDGKRRRGRLPDEKSYDNLGPRRHLTPLQREVYELVRHRSRQCDEVAKALLIEFSMARWALDSLANRSLIEIGGYKGNPTWRCL